MCWTVLAFDIGQKQLQKTTGLLYISKRKTNPNNTKTDFVGDKTVTYGEFKPTNLAIEPLILVIHASQVDEYLQSFPTKSQHEQNHRISIKLP